MVVVDMDFVVDPRIIYGLYVLTMLRNTAIGMILASLLIIIIAGIYSLNDYEEYEVDIKKWVKRGLISAGISFIPVLLIPDKDTCLTLLALYYVTPDNIMAVQGNIVDFVGKLAEAINFTCK